MIRFRLPVLLVGLLAAQLAVPAEAKDLTLDPSGKWILNYANDSCRLLRDFGTGEETVTLILDQFQPWRPPSLSLMGKPLSQMDSRTVLLKATFGPGLPEAMAKPATLGLIGPDKLPIVIGSARDLLNRDLSADETLAQPGTPLPTPEQEAAITRVQISSGSLQIGLNTGPLAAPMKAMRQCLHDLVRDWGLDPDQQDALSRHAFPRSNPSNWLTFADYPERALSSGESAVINFRLMVGANGVPTSCHIQQATIASDLITATCNRLMLRARFKPALDAQGKTLPSFYTNSVKWVTFK